MLGGKPSGKESPIPPAPNGPSDAVPENRSGLQRMELDRIHPCPFQPRKEFAEEALRELADSIREQGILQPLVVRPSGEGYELIAGERRYRAARLAGLKEAPVIVREADDRAVLELALIENLQRENLNPLEEALGFSQLIEQFDLKQEEAAAKVGKSRAAVANALRLLKLPVELQDHLRSGRLSVGHAKVVLGLGRSEEQKLAADRILRDGLSVRQTEELVGQWQNRAALEAAKPVLPGPAPVERDPHVMDLENRLKQRLSTKVALRYRQGKGSIEIQFFNDAELNRITELLGLQSE